MPRIRSVLTVVLVVALGFVATAATAANDRASCNGILVSSAAGTPGLVADLTLTYHQIAKDLGYPPGVVVDAPGGQLHSGSVEQCLVDLGG
jgi:hypothetical protein